MHHPGQRQAGESVASARTIQKLSQLPATCCHTHVSAAVGCTGSHPGTASTHQQGACRLPCCKRNPQEAAICQPQRGGGEFPRGEFHCPAAQHNACLQVGLPIGACRRLLLCLLLHIAASIDDQPRIPPPCCCLLLLLSLLLFLSLGCRSCRRGCLAAAAAAASRLAAPPARGDRGRLTGCASAGAPAAGQRTATPGVLGAQRRIAVLFAAGVTIAAGPTGVHIHGAGTPPAAASCSACLPLCHRLCRQGGETCGAT